MFFVTGLSREQVAKARCQNTQDKNKKKNSKFFS